MRVVVVAVGKWITTRYWGWVGTRARTKSRRRSGEWRWSFIRTSIVGPPRPSRTALPSDSSRSPRPMRSSATIASAPTTISGLAFGPQIQEPAVVTVTVTDTVIRTMEANIELALALAPVASFRGLRMCFASWPRERFFSMLLLLGMCFSNYFKF